MGWKLTVRTFLTLLGFLHWTSAQRQNCSPFPHAGGSQCSSSDRQKDPFREMDSQLTEAMTTEHALPFVVSTEIEMYKFLHPCATEVEAALKLFYDEHSTVPDQSSSWWGQMSQAMQDTALVGRRRRQTYNTHRAHYASEHDLLNHILQRLVHETGSDTGCVQYLIEKYKGVSARTFKQQHPGFYVPTTPPPTTTTTPRPTTTTPRPTTPTTTPRPTTPKPTTPKPTTPTTTPRPTTSKPTTPTPTTTTPRTTTATSTTTTTPAPTTAPASVTYGPISCTTCTGLMCLLGSHVTACPAGQSFCETTVEETATGRQISRGCAMQASCVSHSQSQDVVLCSQVDHQMLPSGNTCHFCCLGDNCNRPPGVKPAAAALYPQP